ncbi:GmrSD restriction endonuclease domain-containing protein [Persicobacter psychrovividus]|uniref:GmrSD restriction endonuclease domain-containing protein n=1 Tax=Persicobacter psychrovividus TaxID=387638 RepID=UPI0030CA2507
MQKMPSSSAQDRQIEIWFQKIEHGEIKLPRFQRPQAWDNKRVASLLNTVINNLPLGVTLLLNVEEEQFVSRYISTAPETNHRVTEHLLDGQQRLTALWRALHNNYEQVKYFVHYPKFAIFDEYKAEPELEDVGKVFTQTRWKNKHGVNMPLWADHPDRILNRGLIPFELLMPGDKSNEIEDWIEQATASKKPKDGDEDLMKKLQSWMDLQKEINKVIRDYRETIAHFNLPFLALPVQTTKETALNVFINMNTNSKPLSQYDIIRAEIEGVKGVSIDDYQQQLDQQVPLLKDYWDLPFLILASSALIQNKLPNQRGMWDMKKDLMIENWDKMADGLSKMVVFLDGQGIYDKNRLPTNAVLSVIAALYSHVSESLDERAVAEKLLRKYLWTAFFTDRYENSAANNAYKDYLALKRVILSETKEDGSIFSEEDVVIFDQKRYPLVTQEELLSVGWPKRENIRARGVMAIFSKLGAEDFADGTKLTRQQLIDGSRQYHHVFPASLLKDCEVNENLVLNCALISDKTNLNISNKAPYTYLLERYQWATTDDVDARLATHLIPAEKLKNEGYDHLTEQERQEKIAADYHDFVRERARLTVKAVQKLVMGEHISVGALFEEEYQLPASLSNLHGAINAVELSLRALTASVLQAKSNRPFDQFVSERSKENIAKKLQRYLSDNPADSVENYLDFSSQLNFFTLGELKDTITANNNYKYFEAIFGNRHALNNRFRQLSTLRNQLAHNNEPTDIMVKDGEAAIIWFNQILEAQEV